MNKNVDEPSFNLQYSKKKQLLFDILKKKRKSQIRKYLKMYFPTICKTLLLKYF